MRTSRRFHRTILNFAKRPIWAFGSTSSFVRNCICGHRPVPTRQVVARRWRCESGGASGVITPVLGHASATEKHGSSHDSLPETSNNIIQKGLAFVREGAVV